MEPGKTCFACKRSLPRSEFYRHKSMADGILGKCKECTRADVNANRARRRDLYRDLDRERQRRYREQGLYKDRMHARQKVRHALGSGKLIKPEVCSKCLGGKHIEAHHEDYSRVLDVTWLCRSCHRALHHERKESVSYKTMGPF